MRNNLALVHSKNVFRPLRATPRGGRNLQECLLQNFSLSLSLSLVAVAKSWIHCALCMQIRLPLGASVECISRRRGAHTWKHAWFVRLETTTSTLYPLVSRRGKIVRVVIRRIAKSLRIRLDCSPVTIATRRDLHAPLRFKRQTWSSIRDIPRGNVNFSRVERCRIDTASKIYVIFFFSFFKNVSSSRGRR